MVRVRPILSKAGKAFIQALRVLPLRLYALSILLIVLWTGYMAVAYLMRSVFSPMPVPEQFVRQREPLDVDTLRTDRSKTTSSAALGHYHETDRGFQPDLFNGCATSGCHSPLPHTKSKEVRSFVNFHATFLNCGMCHDAAAKNPLEAIWVSKSDGKPQETPALLKLIHVLDVDAKKIEMTPSEAHTKILQLLSDSIKTVGGDPVLDYLRIEIDTSEPGSPVWRHALAQLTTELPKHARGEYGAKLAPKETAAALETHARELRERTDQYFASAPDSAQRDKIYQEIHASVRAKPDACLTCHGNEPPRLDFESLGYTPERSATLQSSPIARLIQQIREGRPFHLPSMMEGER